MKFLGVSPRYRAAAGLFLACARLGPAPLSTSIAVARGGPAKLVHWQTASNIPDSDGFAGCVCPYSRRLTDSFVVPSSATIASLPDSTPGCSYVVLRFAAETVVRILFNRQPRIRGRGRAAAPCFRLSTAQVQSSTVPTGVWLPDAHASGRIRVPLRGACHSGSAQAHDSVAG